MKWKDFYEKIYDQDAADMLLGKALRYGIRFSGSETLWTDLQPQALKCIGMN